MIQEINLIVKIDETKFVHSLIVSDEELNRLDINKNKQCIKGKEISSLNTECHSCNQQLLLNVYWYEEEKKLLSLREAKVVIEPLVQIKEEVKHEYSDESMGEDFCDSPSPVALKPKNKKKLSSKTHSSKYVMYPGLTYLLPEGLTLPSFTNIQVPYFETVRQDDGSVIYIEKKRRKKCTIRVTNYDPRNTSCDICGYEVPSSDRLTAHRRAHFFFKYTDQVCRGCGKFCGDNANDKVNHSFFCLGKDSINGLACLECTYEASDYKRLRNHMKKNHKGFNPVPEPNRDKEVKCDLCGTTVIDDYALTLHQKNKCPLFEEHNARRKAQIDTYIKNLDLPPNIVLPDIEKIKGKQSTMIPQADGSSVFLSKGSNHLEIMNFDPRKEKCELCGKAHMLKKAEVVEHRLKRHFFPHETDVICPGCGKECKTIDEKTAHSHFCPKKHLIRVNYCLPCDIQYDNYPKYAKHLRRLHAGEGLDKKFMCHFCSVTYDTSRELRIHVIRHKDPRPFKCHHCTEDFKDKGGLETHLIRSHFPHEAKYTCNICDPPQIFSSAKPYKGHMNIVHLNAREREPCPICGIMLRKSGMDTHVRRQHTEHEFKEKLPCPTCGKFFVSQNNLKVHMKTHLPEYQRPFKCRFCERRFNTTRVCTEHERLHTGEKPYKCKTCGKAYARSETLKDHQREHTGEGYTCSVCSRTFTDRGNFRHHMKQHENQLGVKLTLNHEDRRLIKLKVITEEQALRGERS